MKARVTQTSFVIEIPLEERDRAFLRMLGTTMGGRMPLVTLFHRQRAEACETAGYCRIIKEDRQTVVRLTSRGMSYLDKIRGAH